MTKKIAVIQDLSGFGRCSLTAALPIISVMGVQPCPMPTAVLTAQTGYPSYYMDDLTDKMEYFREEWQKMQVHFDGIYTGFVASEQQIRNILSFIETFKEEDTFLLVDPVMGDDGKVYDMFTPTLCKLMKELSLQADIITPNLTELCLLTEMPYEGLLEITDVDELVNCVTAMARHLMKMGPSDVIVTGLRYVEDGVKMMGNLAVNRQGVSLAGAPLLGASYSGTGDIFASIVAGGVARGDDLGEIVTEARDFITTAIKRSPKEGEYNPDGVDFEPILGMLIKNE